MPTSSELDNGNLAQLLRECASLVESNDANASAFGIFYKTLEALHIYTEKSNSARTNKHDNNQTKATATSTLTRPSFQKPTNKKSNLIANGWVEQQRRSKLRVVWKEVLASLVEARRPGEETTLWIQRENIDLTSVGSNKGKKTLEALHQIPMKWLLDVKYLDFYGDFRFSIKVFNVMEDFVFRAVDEESCKEWVSTLKSAKDGGVPSGSNHSSNSTHSADFPDLLNIEKSTNNTHAHTDHAVFPDLDMNSGQPKPSAPPMSMGHEPKNNTTAYSNSMANNQGVPKKDRKSIKELRAIAHAEGYDTRGMERSDLEKIAAYFAPVSVKNELFQQQQKQQHQQKQKPQQQQQQQQQVKNQKPQVVPNNNDKAYEKQRAAEVERIRKHQEEERIRQQKDYIQKKQHEARIRNEELKKQTAAARIINEQEQNQSQQRKQWNNQQHAWKTKSTTSKNHSFESNRFVNSSSGGGVSGPRRKHAIPNKTIPNKNGNHHFKPHSQQQQSQPDPPASTSSTPPSQYPQRTAFNQQQQRPTNSTPMPPPPPPQNYHQQTSQSAPNSSNNQRSSDPTSPLNQKYAKVMSNNHLIDDKNSDEASIAMIKRNILISWALVPPQYNMLCSIDKLLVTIQTVFPPFSNVPKHEYFSKWKAIQSEDLYLSSAVGHSPDAVKLKKTVRKLRVLLHPDRLPREFDAKQSFVCKMLWDVSNDAYEEFLKQKDDLDWIHK